jgi:hypothetical protein
LARTTTTIRFNKQQHQPTNQARNMVLGNNSDNIFGSNSEKQRLIANQVGRPVAAHLRIVVFLSCRHCIAGSTGTSRQLIGE